VTDRHIAKIVSKLQDLPGQDLFQCVDDEGEVRAVTSQDVNEYLREITGEDFSAKDFRTLAGTVLTAVALNAQEEFENTKQAKANIRTAINAVAKILGNTPSICRKCYVHPVIFESYLSRQSIDGLKQLTEDALEKEDVDLRSSEAAVLKFLESRLTNKAG
jgi:DNA topoisomerase I